MAKEVVKKIKLQIEAGKATPAPPVGTCLGPAGINIQEFCQKFNDATRDKMGDVIPCEINVYDDRSFDFALKSANEIVATITIDDLRKIAETKLPDLNAYTVEEAMKIVEGTARNMGIAVKGLNDQELAEHAKEAQKEEAMREKREEELEAMEEAAHNEVSAEVEVIGKEKDSEEE